MPFDTVNGIGKRTPRKVAQRRVGAERWNKAGQEARAQMLLHHEAE